MNVIRVELKPSRRAERRRGTRTVKNGCAMHPQTHETRSLCTDGRRYHPWNVSTWKTWSSPTRNKDIHGNISDEIKRSLHSLRVTFSERKYAPSQTKRDGRAKRNRAHGIFAYSDREIAIRTYPRVCSKAL